MNDGFMQFYALYLGSSRIVDSTEKKALKVATRQIVQRDDSLLLKSFEVDVHLLANKIQLRRKHVTTNKSDNVEMVYNDSAGAIIDVGFNLIASCFILREDNKIVSIAITDKEYTCAVHVLMLTSIEMARNMVTNICQKFTNPVLFNGNNERIDLNQSLSEDDEPRQPNGCLPTVTQCSQITSSCLLDFS